MAEDQQIIDFVMSQCQPSYNSTGTVTATGEATAAYQEQLDGCEYFPAAAAGHQHHPWMDISNDQFRLYSSSLNLFSGDQNYVNGDSVQQPLDSIVDNAVHDLAAYHQSMMMGARSVDVQSLPAAPSVLTREARGAEGDGVKQEGPMRADSGLDGSDQGEDDDDQRLLGRGGKRHHSKNLVAERKRRKKLNDRLYALRALVPNISKMDRASILGDAIEYVLDLQKQIKDLQDELEEANPDAEDAARQMGISNSNCHMEASNPIGDSLNSSRTVAKSAEAMKHCSDHGGGGADDDKGPQMEPHVEVRPVEGNEFFLKVLCEQRPGGFMRLMEAMSSLGLEVTNANVTTFKTLVLNVFRVEKRDNEGVHAEQVRDSILLEVTRSDAGRGWSEMVAEGAATRDYQHYHQQQLEYLSAN